MRIAAEGRSGGDGRRCRAGPRLDAHVTVQPREVAAKSSQEFLVRVPTEKDQPTTSVRIVFPEGFEVLRVRPTSGWKNEFERDAAGRITGITWSGGTRRASGV